MKHTFLNPIEFTEADNSDGVVWVDAFKKGTWVDPRYGDTIVDDDMFNNIIKNFNDNVRGVEIGVDFQHGKDVAKGNKAAGWIKQLRAVGDKIQAAISFTEEAKAEIKDRQWRYFSPQWEDDYTHSEGGAKHKHVLLMGSLTNAPVFKGMAPINFSEVLDAELTLTEEVENKEKEHGEPGTGPAPRERESEPVHFTPKHPLKNDPDVSPGTEQDSPLNLVKEGVVDEAAIRKLLGIAEDVDIGTHLETLLSDAKAFAEVRDKANAVKTFAEAYPEQYKENQELKTKVLKSEAKEFAESFTKPIKDAEGKDSKVVPPIVAEKIEEAYIEFAEGRGTIDSFSKVMDSVRTAGMVTLGENGSSNDDESHHADAETKIKNFAEEMGRVMLEDKLDPQAAMEKVAKEHPDLYQEYINTSIPASGPAQ